MGRRVRLNPSTLHRELQGEGVLLQLDTGEYYGLDDVGQRIWALLMESGDVAGVEQRLLEEFDVEPEILARDVADLVDDLIRQQLLDDVTAEASSTAR